jgi:hypothetical protein
MIDIIPSMVTPVLCAKSGVEAEQFLMVSHFKAMNKDIEVHFMVFIYLLILFNYNYFFDSILMIMIG